MSNIQKVKSYLGFASKSRNLVAGQGKVIDGITKGTAILIIIGLDVGDNTKDKLVSKCKSSGVTYRIFESCENLGHWTGHYGKGVLGITDENFSEVILKEIDQIQSEKEEF